MAAKFVIAQGGGPTAVINQTVVGINNTTRWSVLDLAGGSLTVNNAVDGLRLGSGFAGQVRENGLHDILGAVGIAGGAAERGGIYQVDILSHQLAKSRFGTVLGVIAQQ